MVHAFDNIGVCVTNLERSVAFYEMLGPREVYGNERGVLISAVKARLFLSRNPAGEFTSGRSETRAVRKCARHRSHQLCGRRRRRHLRATERSWGGVRWRAARSALGRPHGWPEGPGRQQPLPTAEAVVEDL